MRRQPSALLRSSEELIGKIAEESGGVAAPAFFPRKWSPVGRRGLPEIGGFRFPAEALRLRGHQAKDRLRHRRRPVQPQGRPASLFIGRSAAIRAVEDLIRLYAGSGYPVLITGESGAGKGIAAHALGDLAPRGIGSLRRSELRGNSRASRRKRALRHGKGGLYGRGSESRGLSSSPEAELFFLDEIGEASLSFPGQAPARARDGRVLAPRRQQERRGRFRFVSATGKDLERAVAEGGFRPICSRVNT